MFEVKVFDGQGNLKEIIPSEEVLRMSNEAFANGGNRKHRLEDKKYTCLECKSVFTSRSSSGAKYCNDCRPNAYKRRRKNSIVTIK